jgi:two-component system, NarL family, sensor kinase
MHIVFLMVKTAGHILLYRNKLFGSFSFIGLVIACNLFFCSPMAYAGFFSQDTVEISRMLNEAGDIATSNPDKAISIYAAAQKQSESIRFMEGVARARVGQASILIGKNINEAIAVAHEAVNLCEQNQLGDDQLMAEARLLLASAFEEQGRSDSSAYYYYLLGRQIEGGIKIQPAFAVGLYTKLAIFWLNLYYGSEGSVEYRRVLTDYVERAREAAQNMPDQKDAISSTYFLEGAYHHAIQQYDSARYYYKEYLRVREPLGLIGWQRKASCYVNIAETFLTERNGREAIVFLQKAREILRSPAAAPYSQYYAGFTDLKLAHAYQLQGKYAECIELIESTLIKMGGTSDRLNMNIVDAYNVAALAYESVGNYEKALFYNKLFIARHDSLLKKENLDMINGMEVRYRMVEKDRELAESKLAVEAARKKVQKRNMLVAVVLGLMVFGGAFAYVWKRKNEHKQRLQLAQLDNMHRNLEIERLNATLSGEEMERNRIARELHDGVGGLLSAAKMNLELFEKKTPLTDKTDLNEGIALLQIASSELRKTAHNLMPEILMHEGLPKAIQNYCASLSGKNSPVIQVQVLGKQDKLSPHFEFSIYRIVQELVHNMVRHSKATEGLVELNYRGDGGVDLTIEDNGIGLPDPNQEGTGEGLGLRNVKQRIKAIDGHLDIRSSPGMGTSFFIEFAPVPKKEEV